MQISVEGNNLARIVAARLEADAMAEGVAGREPDRAVLIGGTGLGTAVRAGTVMGLCAAIGSGAHAIDCNPARSVRVECVGRTSRTDFSGLKAERARTFEEAAG